MPFKYPSPVDRLIAHTALDKRGCWIWLGSYNNMGRPRIAVRVSGRVKWMLVTRYVLKYVHGVELKKQHKGLHSCDNKCCVSPNCINRGTQKQNVQQCVERGRHDPYAGVVGRLMEHLWT